MTAPADVPLARAPERVAFTALCAVLGALVPLLGWLSPAPGAADPLGLRLALGGALVVLGALPWCGERVRAAGLNVARGFVPLAAAGCVAVAALNGFAGAYAAGAVAVLVAAAVAGAIVYDSLKPVAAALALPAAVGLAGLLGGPALGLAVAAPVPGYAALLSATALAAALGAGLHVRARQQAGASEARFRAVFAGSTEGVFLCDAEDFTYLDANAAYLRTVGYALAELRQKTVAAVGDTTAADLAAVVRTARASAEGAVHASRHRSREGLEVPLRLHVRAVALGGRPALCVTAHDLTERLRADEELRRAKEEAEEMLNLKGAFLANMSHELRTPLVGILGFAEILSEELPEEFREGMGVIYRSAVRLQETLNSVLDLAQLEGGGVTLRPETVDVVAAADETAALLRPMAEAKGIFLHTVAVNASKAWLDRAAFDRILTNLVTNAIKFTNAGGVTVEVATDSHRVLVRVRDTGIGMAPELVPQLFREFRQASQGLDRTHEGNGLGLAIVKRLVDLMGGRIVVESAPGQGSVFTVAFARSFVAPGTGGQVRLSAEPRVLVVEDNADTARVMARALRARYDVTVATSADEAERRAQEEWFDALVIDVQLGTGRNGAQLLQALRRMSAYEFVPAIATSAGLLQRDVEYLYAMGFAKYLPKPFTRDGLLRAVEDVRAVTREEPIVD